MQFRYYYSQTQYDEITIHTNKLSKGDKLDVELIREFGNRNLVAPFSDVRKFTYKSHILVSDDELNGGEIFTVSFDYTYNYNPFSFLVYEAASENRNRKQFIISSVANRVHKISPNAQFEVDSEKSSDIKIVFVINWGNESKESREEKIKKGKESVMSAYNVKNEDELKDVFDEIEKDPEAFLIEDDLRDKFCQDGRDKCILTGECGIMSHIVPNKPRAFYTAVQLFVKRHGLWDDGKKFVTVHDLRNVLPLSCEFDEEYDDLGWTIVCDTIQSTESISQWKIWVLDENTMSRLPKYEKKPVNMVKFWKSKSDEEKEKIEAELNEYIKKYKIFSRCLYAHSYAFCMKWSKYSPLYQLSFNNFCPSFVG